MTPDDAPDPWGAPSGGPIRLVQLADGADRRVALVDEPDLRLIASVSVYELALQAAGSRGDSLADRAR